MPLYSQLTAHGDRAQPWLPAPALVLKGIARDKGTRRRQKAAATRSEVLRLPLALHPSSITVPSANDQAFLLLGPCAGLHRSKLSGLGFIDATSVPDGWRGALVVGKSWPCGTYLGVPESQSVGWGLFQARLLNAHILVGDFTRAVRGLYQARRSLLEWRIKDLPIVIPGTLPGLPNKDYSNIPSY